MFDRFDIRRSNSRAGESRDPQSDESITPTSRQVNSNKPWLHSAPLKPHRITLHYDGTESSTVRVEVVPAAQEQSY